MIIRKALFVSFLVVLLASPAIAWESEDRTDNPNELKYNPMDNEWSYEKPDSVIKYNPQENKWDYTKPDSELKYNPMENKWEYTK